MLQHRFSEIMKKKTLFCVLSFFLLGFASLVVPACYYDNEEDLYGSTTNCETSDVRYSVEIKQLMESKCFSCHKLGEASYSGISLEDHSSVQDYANDGSLMDRLTTSDATKLMPPGSPLSSCEVKKVEAWINAGALDN